MVRPGHCGGWLWRRWHWLTGASFLRPNVKLSSWAQGILTVQPVDATTLQGLDWPYLIHLVLGMTIFLLFPFSRLVHIWSAPVWYLGRRGYQVVRTRRDMTADASRRPAQHPAE